MMTRVKDSDHCKACLLCRRQADVCGYMLSRYMNYFDDQNKQLVKITIYKKRKTNIILKINHQNFNKCCKSLIQAFRNHQKFKTTIIWEWKNKLYANLLQKISLECIILNKTGLLGFLPCQKTNSYINTSQQEEQFIINNCVIFFKLFFSHKRIIYVMMNNEKQWKYFFICFRNLMESKFIMSPKHLELVKIFTNTFCYWTYEHICYLKEIHFLNALSTAMINGYFHKWKRTEKLRVIVDFIIKIFYIFDNYLYKYNERKQKYITFNKTIDENTYYQMNGPRLGKINYLQCDEKYNKLKIFKKPQAYHNYILQMDTHMRNIDQFRKNQCKSFVNTYYDNQLQFSDEFVKLSMINMKICANAKCKKYTSNNDKFFKFKICKNCKIVHYCNRKCQKYDWKFNHKNICNSLMVKLSNN